MTPVVLNYCASSEASEPSPCLYSVRFLYFATAPRAVGFLRPVSLSFPTARRDFTLFNGLLIFNAHHKLAIRMGK